MIVTIKCLHCNGAGTVELGALLGRPTGVCPLCYGVRTKRVRVQSIADVDARSIVSVTR